jgi:hypothetical protein
VFLNWGSVRYASGFKKLSRFFSVEHEIISFIIFFVILDLLLLLLAKLLFFICFCSYLMRFCIVQVCFLFVNFPTVLWQVIPKGSASCLRTGPWNWWGLVRGL